MLRKVIIALLFNMLFLNAALSQDAGAGDGAAGGGEDIFQESIMDLSLVAYGGVGGAILGLSTLSFVEEPGDHLKNILVGTAVGIIVGVAVVAYRQAASANENYENAFYQPSEKEFSTSDRLSWAKKSHQNNFQANPNAIGWALDF